MAEGVAAKVIADILDLDERTVRKYAAAGIMVRIGHGKYALRESVRGYAAILRKAAAGHVLTFDHLVLDALASESLNFDLDWRRDERAAPKR
jgi:phage terminase Nu1 subunit (DNA packaging protein)